MLTGGGLGCEQPWKVAEVSNDNHTPNCVALKLHVLPSLYEFSLTRRAFPGRREPRAHPGLGSARLGFCARGAESPAHRRPPLNFSSPREENDFPRFQFSQSPSSAVHGDGMGISCAAPSLRRKAEPNPTSARQRRSL